MGAAMPALLAWQMARTEGAAGVDAVLPAAPLAAESSTAVTITQSPEKAQHPQPPKAAGMPTLPQIQTLIYKAGIGFKVMDTVVSMLKTAYQPTPEHAKQTLGDTAVLYGFYQGVNHYTLAVSGAEVAYQIYSSSRSVDKFWGR